ncbi:DUF2963 domain-containing protein [Paulownia witches'-broom phytoplasma]|uniref:DUF2963 domain-containing protein n=1 Tax=Paulownia witches'-broom phytoplasma TaxID=39647 RepID=UPI002D1E77D0|nr:hypothetical protein PAWBP_7500 [Paulownia witches'-broom phytoplasma]
MKNNNQPKSKNKKIIFIIWGLFISVSVIGLLIILLLALQPEQASKSTPKQIQIPQQPNSQQEEETYNDILNKINKEVDKLTNEEEIVYHPGSKTINYIKVYDSKTKKEIKRIYYKLDGGKTLKLICEITLEGDITKATYYQEDEKTIKWIKDFKPEVNQGQITYYAEDGKTILDVQTF